MTAATRTEPGALARARRERDTAQAALDRLALALDDAEQGFATVVRIEHVRAILRAR